MKPTVITIYCFKIKNWLEVSENRQWRSISLSIGGLNLHWYVTAGSWLWPIMMLCYHCWLFAWAGSDSCTVLKPMSFSLLPPHLSLSLSIAAAIFHQNAQWRSWIFKHGHDLLVLRLVTSMHSFKFVAFQLIWWLDCLILMLVVSLF